MIRFFLSLLGVSVVLGVLMLVGEKQAWWAAPPFWIGILFFNTFLTSLIGLRLFKIRATKPEVFVHFYLASIVFKMVFGLGLLFLLVWKYPEHIRSHAIIFIVSYLLFTSFEVIFLVKRSG